MGLLFLLSSCLPNSALAGRNWANVSLTVTLILNQPGSCLPNSPKTTGTSVSSSLAGAAVVGVVSGTVVVVGVVDSSVVVVSMKVVVVSVMVVVVSVTGN